MSAQGPLIFLDLDDTIFSSARRTEGAGPEARHRVGYLDEGGEPGGYCSARQWALIQWLQGSGVVIPVTARRLNALSRVQIPFHHGAVCCGGGVMLTPGGRRDLAWAKEMGEALAPHQAALQALRVGCGRRAEALRLSVRCRLVGDQAGTEMYLGLKARDREPATLMRLLDAVEIPEGWHVHRHGHSAALAPPPLCKEAAVARLIERWRPALTVGVGDSSADRGFMALCDVAMTPTGSDLFQALQEARLR